MRNPFQTPQLLPQWVLSSACWVISCLGGFLLFCTGLFKLLPFSDDMIWVLGAAGVVCIVMWKQVIVVGWRLWSDNEQGVTLNVVAGLWLLALTVVCVLSALGITFGTLIWLAVSNEPPSTSGSGWMD